MSSSENDDINGQHVDDLDAIKKKLNNALSSHFSDSSSAKESVLSPAENPNNLLEIVSECAKVKDCDLAPGMKEEVEYANSGDVLDNVVTGQLTEDVEVTKDGSRSKTDNNNLSTNLFSEAFGKVEYQSVDLDIATSTAEASDDEVSSHYSQVVLDALKRTPKASQDTSGHDSRALEKKPIDLSSIWDDEPECGDFECDKIECVKPKGNPESCGSSDSLSPSTLSPSSSTSAVSKKNTSSESLEKLKQKVLAKSSDVSIKKKDVAPSTSTSNAIVKDPVNSDKFHSKKIALLYNEKHLKHESGPLSIKTHERPERLVKAMWYLQKNAVFDDETCILIDDFDAVDESCISRVHDESYINFVNSYAKAGGGFLGDSTYIVSESYNVAKCSAGAAVKAGDLVADGLYSYSFALTRPPGHHASKNKYGGFCLFNNAAILARYLQKEKNIGKIMIIDWDAHAGDGTMDIFYDDPNVLFVSLHRDPHGFYPRKGFTEETGVDAGKGYTVNVEMPAGAGDGEYVFAFDEIVMPLINNYSPEFIICSCGFDAHYKEKNIGLNVTSEGYYQMALRVATKFPNNFVLLMEGGYHDFNGQLCHSVLSALMGEPNPVLDNPQVSSFKLDQQKKILEQTKVKVAELKKTIPMLS